ncbi:ParB/RepB/Spo0J family partition protein [Nesterenkonia sp. Act20]|uniref:ParB/RepB/Spo0J family partition protein n=1 Tax=Nesterenkonia sp. Act20 TaxID=1483432 RepID=UPI001C43CC45|nr:ParB/RepB/Spo0J family partition protein [Nesterenkonia sp. Act20]
MAERKRRGLGRGLGALINSDSQDQEQQEAASETGSSPLDSGGPDSSGAVSRETSDVRSSTPRPIDVFFSAKSDLEGPYVARESTVIQRSATSSRRPSAGQRAPMPDVLSRGTGKSAERPMTPQAGAEATTDDETKERQGREESSVAPAQTQDNSRLDAGPEGAWTNSVSRETSGKVDGAEFRSVPVDSIVPNPRQPRQEFDEEHMDELIHSIREIGMLQPVVVRPAGAGLYELVMGERRWRASKAANLETVPAIVRMTKDDDLLRDALLENIHRSQLNPLEEAAAYRQLLDDFNCTQDELAERIGRSRPQISNTLRLMKLPPAVQRRVAAGVLSSGHARALLGLKSPEQMEQLAGRIVAEGLSVRATEEAVTLAQRDQRSSWDLGRERTKSPRVQQLEEFSDALTDRLDTQVKITLGAKKGRIAIDFGSIDDLHRLMDMIGSRG